MLTLYPKLMKWAFIFALILHPFFVYAQVDLKDDLHDQVRPYSSPLFLPINVDLEGNVTLNIPGSTQSNVRFSPSIQAGVERLQYTFSNESEAENVMRFTPIEDPNNSVSILRRRVEFGAGALLVARKILGYFNVSASIQPYAGSFWWAKIHGTHKKYRGFWRLPKNSDDLKKWQTGDSRSYQVYGGLSLFVNAGAFGINPLQTYVTKQKKWIVTTTKISDTKINVQILDQNWSKEAVQFSAAVIIEAREHLKIHEKSFTMIYDLERTDDQKAFRDALRGNLTTTQKLNLLGERLHDHYRGNQTYSRYGVPYIFTLAFTQGMLKKIARDDGSILMYLKTRNRRVGGILTKEITHFHHSFYFPQENKKPVIHMALYQGKNLNAEVFKKRTMQFTRSFGIFAQNDVPENLGDIQTQISMQVDESFFSVFKLINIDAFEAEFAFYCIDRKLNCQNDDIRRNVLDSAKYWQGQLLADEAQARVEFVDFLSKWPLLWNILIQKVNYQMPVQIEFHSELYKMFKATLIPKLVPLHDLVPKVQAISNN